MQNSLTTFHGYLLFPGSLYYDVDTLLMCFKRHATKLGGKFVNLIVGANLMLSQNSVTHHPQQKR